MTEQQRNATEVIAWYVELASKATKEASSIPWYQFTMRIAATITAIRAHRIARFLISQSILTME